MLHEKLPITVQGYEETAELYTYILDNSPEIDDERVRPLVLICPGGGYGMTSDREAEAIALQFMAAGMHAAILRYSVLPSRFPTALLQLATAVSYLREHATRYHIHPDKIIVQGFSAGGHLAGSLGVFWNKPWMKETMKMDAKMFRPNGLLLCYPVIATSEKGHQSSIENLLGDRYAELKEEMSLDQQVTADTPPVFLWHTAADDCVPVENSIYFFQAALEAGVPVELHIYPVGGHGLSLANEETAGVNVENIQKECQSWMELAKKWATTI